MIRSHPGLDWKKVYRRAESLHAQRMLNVGLALAADLLGAALPEEVSARVKGDRVAVELAAAIERRLLSRELPPLSAAAAFPLSPENSAGRRCRVALRAATGHGSGRGRLGNGAPACGPRATLYCVAADPAAAQIWRKTLSRPGVEWLIFCGLRWLKENRLRLAGLR